MLTNDELIDLVEIVQRNVERIAYLDERIKKLEALQWTAEELLGEEVPSETG